MITGNIKDFEKYLCMHKSFPKAFEYMKKCIIDDNAFIDEPDVKGKVTAKETNDKYDNTDIMTLEAHRKYIDIHFITDGAERFGYAHIDRLKPTTEFDEEKDFQLLVGKADSLILKKGDFIITYPEDAHAPSLKCSESDTVKRTVIKIIL